MLISLILTLVSDTLAVLPGYLGRANYAEMLNRLRQFAPELTDAIHNESGPKPLTCSNLFGLRVTGPSLTIEPGQPCAVRITGLTAPISQLLQENFLATPPTQWCVHDHTFAVVEVICDAAKHAWSGSASYEGLAAAQLKQGERPPRQVTLEFASPTSFKSGGMHVPVPLPGLVFGSLVERWNAFSTVTLSPEMRRFGEEMLAMSRYRLESRPVEQKNDALRIGGVGQATYVAVGGDRYWLSVMQMLADFALYSGVGVQTTTGMGQVRRINR